MANFFEYFDQLSARNEESRRSGVEQLTEFLLSDSSHQMTYRNSTAFEYCLQRLVKGLSAYSFPTLHGFVTSLICVLDSIEGMIPRVYNLIDKHLVSPPHAKSSEVKGYRIGQVLALSALSRSVEFSRIQSELRTVILGRICSFLHQDGYLKTASTQVVSDYISHITVEELGELLPLISEKLHSSSLETCSPETLSLLFSLLKSFPACDLCTQLLVSTVGVTALDQVEHLPAITDTLLTAVSSPSPVHPALAFGIDYFLGTELFHSLWTLLVEEGVFELESDQKYFAFDLLAHAIRTDPPLQHVFFVLSPRMLSLLNSALRSSKEPLKFKALQATQSIFSLIQNRTVAPHTIITLRLLLFTHNLPQDISTLYKEAYSKSDQHSNDTLEFIKSLFENFLQGSTLISYPPLLSPLSESPSPLLASQEYSLSLLTHLSKLTGSISSQVEEAILKFLVTHSYFHMLNSGKSFFPPNTQLVTELADDTRIRCQQALLQMLTHFLPNDLRNVVYFPQLGFAMKWAITLLDKSKHVTVCSQQLDSEVTQLFRGVRARTLELESTLEEGGDMERAQSLLLTFIQYHTMVALSNASSTTKRTLTKLLDCYGALSQDCGGALATGECVDDLIAEIIRTLSHNTHLSRTLSDALFRCLVPHLTRDALLSLAEAAFTSVESDEEEVVASESESGEATEESGSHSPHSDSSDEECAEGGELSVEERDLKFKLEVSSALGDGEVSGAESLDMDEDEERLKKIDFALAQLFRKKLKTDNPTRVKRQIEISSLHYRSRVLALIQTFVEKRPDSPLLLYLLVPASESLLLLSKTELTDLFSKLSSLYTRKLCRAKCDLSHTPPHLPCTLLKRLFHLALSAHRLELARMISEGVCLLLKLMRRASMLEESFEDLVQNIGEFLNFFAAKKNGYQWNIPFLKVVEFAPRIVCSLVPRLIELISSSVYKFQARKCEEILHHILQSPDCRDSIQCHLVPLHSFFSRRLASIPSIEKVNHCHTSLQSILPYCHLLATCRDESSRADSLRAEVDAVVEEVSESGRVTKSQRLSRTCDSLLRALEGEGEGGARGRRRKRNRRAKPALSKKKTKYAS